MRGSILDLESFDRGDLDLTPLRSVMPRLDEHAATSPDEVVERLAGVEIAISNKVPIGPEAFAALPDLRLVAVAATGTNNIDLEAARKHDVAICNVRAYATPSVVQHVFALMLSLSRNLPAYSAAVDRGQWQLSRQFCMLDWPIGELTGLTLGIVGYGELGRAVADVGKTAFGMQVRIAERPGHPTRQGREPLHELLPEVDVLSLHCPLTPETRGLIGPRELERMKPEALLINTARGGIVDEAALADALRSGRIGGAGVDVLTREPPSSDNPLLAGDIPNLILTPHVAWASREARQRMVNQLGENVRAFLQGQPRNLVNP